MKRTLCVLLALLALGGLVFADGTLVAYYSRTGHTEFVAETIAEATGADVFRIETVDPYTDEDVNWRNPESRVSLQHENPELRIVGLVVDRPEGWESYDTVFIGYPIWYGSVSYPVFTFASLNDFEGKTVIPFCTSTNAGIDGSDVFLSETAGSGAWLPGRRFTEKPEKEDILSWLESL